MKLLFLLVGSVIADEWITESCKPKTYGYLQNCLGKSKSECADVSVCEYQEGQEMEFTETANGRWAWDYYCDPPLEPSQVVYENVPFEHGMDAARNVCWAACDQNTKCDYAIFETNVGTKILYSCTLTDVDCSSKGIHWSDGSLPHMYYVYQKTKQAAITNSGFTIAARTSESACYIDANGCVTDGEGNYENDEKCWFWFTGNGSITFEEFSLEEYEDEDAYYDYLYIEDWDTSRVTYGSDMLKDKTLAVTGFRTFGFVSSSESTWPGFKVCAQVAVDPTPSPVTPTPAPVPAGGADGSSGSPAADVCTANHDSRPGSTSSERCLALSGCCYNADTDFCGTCTDYEYVVVRHRDNSACECLPKDDPCLNDDVCFADATCKDDEDYVVVRHRGDSSCECTPAHDPCLDDDVCYVDESCKATDYNDGLGKWKYASIKSIETLREWCKINWGNCFACGGRWKGSKETGFCRKGRLQNRRLSRCKSFFRDSELCLHLGCNAIYRKNSGKTVCKNHLSDSGVSFDHLE